MNKTMSKWFTGLAGALVVLGILIALNALFSRVLIRKDLTAERLYTLSDGTVEMLKDLDRPVTLKFFYSKSSASVPVPLKNYIQRTLDFLREMSSRSDGHLVLEVWDPAPDSDAEEWAQRYGLTPQSTGGLGVLPDLYLGLVAVSGTREASIPFLDSTAEPQLEYLVARLVHEVTQSRRPRVGLMTPLPVLAESSPYLSAAESGSDWLFVQELKKQYDVESVPMDTNAIPDDLDTLMLIDPKGISGRSLYALDQFVLRGGRLVAFLDPMCISDEKRTDMPAMPETDSGISQLIGTWGVTVDTSRVVADLAASTPINLGHGRAERLPTWLSLRAGENLDPTDLVTGPLESLMMPFAGQIQVTPAKGLTLSTLVHASSNAVTVNAYQARNSADLNLRRGTPAPDAPLAVRLTGSFKTAFPDGPPPPSDSTNEVVTSTATGGLKESETDGAVILIADADLLANAYSVRGVNFFGKTLYQPFNDNLNFTLNLVEQLAGNPALIGLRSRGKFNHPFERVLTMEQTAQEQWQEEEEKLQQKLRNTQQRLNALQSGKSEDQQLVLSAAQKAELEQFRRERFETQRQLKNVRKNLRHSIEALGLKLKVINMAAIPLLVALGGLGYGWIRRRRAVK